MGKCKQCGKRSIFLKVNEFSLCPDCQVLNRRIAEECAKIITGSDHIPEKEAIEPSQYPKAVKYIKSRNGTRISKADYSGIFDLSGLKEVDYNYYILDTEENRSKAIDDISLMKDVYALAKEKIPEIIDATFDIGNIKFDYSEEDMRRYVAISFADKLESGKIPKKSVFLYFLFNDDLRGEIMYTANRIIRSELIISKRTVHESELSIRYTGETYKIVADHMYDHIEIRSITHHDSGNRNVVYRKPKS